ncbi:MAG: RluA family pseudouridine synthase [Bacilli bacterium]
MTRLVILYEDNHIIVVYKFPGILSQSDSTKDLDMFTIVKTYLKDRYHKPGNVYLGLVHRLDRPVKGVMVFAKTSKAAARLSEQIRNGQMHKKYYAIVEGTLKEKEGILENKIEKIDNKKVLIDTPNGKEAKLEYKVIKEKDNLSLVDINLLTGRYHQIRLQFSYINHPLYGDTLYGSKYKGDLALVSYSLSFVHPTTKEKMYFEIKINSQIMTNF